MTRRPIMRHLTLAVALAAPLMATLPSPAAEAALSKDGLYTQLSGSRLGDTRSGGGFGRGRLAAGQTASLTVLGKGGIPTSGVSAVVLNVTAVKSSGTGHVRVFPAGASLPGTSVLNYAKDWTGATTTTVKPGSSGKVSFYAGTSDVDLVVDVVGWYATGSSTAAAGAVFTGGTPKRVADSRSGGGAPVQAGKTFTVEYDVDPALLAAAPPVAAMMNITATGANGLGYVGPLTASGAKSGTSSVNFTEGVTSPNRTIVPLRKVDSNTVSAGVYVGGNATHVVLDDMGWFLQDPAGGGLKHVALTPTRIVDTRKGTGTTMAPLGPDEKRTMTKFPSSLTGANTYGFEGALTGVGPSEGTYLTAWDGSGSRPSSSNLNLQAGASRSNGLTAIYNLTSSKQYAVFNRFGKTELLIDVTGRWDYPTETASSGVIANQRKAFEAVRATGQEQTDR